MQEITRQLKDKILQRDGYKCAYCLEVYEPQNLHIDHIYPRSKGGLNLPENLITACKDCNQEKHDKVLENPPIVETFTLEKGDLIEERFRYPLLTMRLSQEVQNDLRNEWIKSEKSWHLFLKDMLALYKKYNQREP